MACITVDNASFSYDGRSVARDITFSVSSGDYLCVVGENGSGKSTLLKGLLGLKKPSVGSILYADGLVRREIGYLPQQSAIQRDFPASVREVVLSGCLNGKIFRPYYRRIDKEKAYDNMNKLGIAHLAEKCFRSLSGGQQQRVLLARALCATEKLLLLDEPTAGLDPHATAELYQLVSKINDDGITVIMVSHDMSAAITYAKHILHLNHQVLFYGSKEDYLASSVGKLYMQGDVL